MRADWYNFPCIGLLLATIWLPRGAKRRPVKWIFHAKIHSTGPFAIQKDAVEWIFHAKIHLTMPFVMQEGSVKWIFGDINPLDIFRGHLWRAQAGRITERIVEWICRVDNTYNK